MPQMQNPTLLTPADQQLLLHEIGLTVSEARLYNFMMHNPHCVLAAELVALTDLATSTMYRLLNRLEKIGLIISQRLYRGTRYHRLPLSQGLANYHRYQQEVVLPLTHWDHKQDEPRDTWQWFEQHKNLLGK